MRIPDRAFDRLRAEWRHGPARTTHHAARRPGLGPAGVRRRPGTGGHRAPGSSAAWAALAEEALGRGFTIEGYAYARTGYHRGLDALRKAGWRGTGPVPWSHAPNQGFLRALHALAVAAKAIGEDDEAARCAKFLDDCDPEALRGPL